MSKNSITAKNVFAQIFITLVIGIAIGFFVGYPLGKSGVEAPSPAPEPAAIEVAEETEPPETTPDPEPTPEPVEEEDTVTEEELAAPLWPGRHLFIAVRGKEVDDELQALLEEVQPGGVVLLGDNIGDREETAALATALKSAVGMGESISDLPLIAVDQEGGSVNRLELNDAPSFAELGASLDRRVAQELGKRYGAALSARNIGVLFAPVLDVRDENTPEAIAARTLGDNNAVVTPLGLAFADGAMEAGVISVVKHYPGHGATTTDSHEALATITQDIPGLAQTMFPFGEAVERGIRGVMAGHIAVPAVDVDNPELPSSLSPRMLQQVLRKRWEFDGVIIADDINMAAVTLGRTPEEAVVEALAAGNDAVIYLDPSPDRIRAMCAAIEAAVEAGTLEKRNLVESRKRLDSWGEWLQSPRGLRGPLPTVPEHIGVAKAEEPAPEEEVAAVEEPTIPEGEFITHEIERGDTLHKISRKYGVAVNDIMAWNDLEDGNIKFGFKLKIYPSGTTPEPTPEPEPAPEPETDPEPAPAESESEPEEEEEPESPPEPVAQPAGTKKIVHEVTPGQVLSRVAIRYGVKQSEIMAWSGFTDPIIKIGQRLTIYVPEDFELPAEEEKSDPAPEPEATDEPAEEPAQDDEETTEAEPDPEPETADDSAEVESPDVAPADEEELPPPGAPADPVEEEASSPEAEPESTDAPERL